MLSTPRVSSRVASALRGRLLLYFSCLVCLFSAISTRAQTPTPAPVAKMQWAQSYFSPVLAYSPTQPLIATTQFFGGGITVNANIVLLHPDGSVAQMMSAEQGYIFGLAFAPDGQTLASSGCDLNSNCTVKLWRISDGACLQTLAIAQIPFGDQEWYPDFVAFSPDGKTLASSAGDENGNGQIQLWRVRDGVCLQTLTGLEYGVTSLAFAPDGQTLASGAAEADGSGNNGAIQLWRTSDGACAQTLTGNGEVFSVAFAPDGQTLAAGAVDGSGMGIVQLWRVSDGACTQTIAGQTSGVLSVAFAPDGQTLASSGGDASGNGIIQLWRTSDNACLQTITEANAEFSSIAFAPDGQTLASGGYSASIQIWRVSDGVCLQTVNSTYNVTSVAFAPDGQTLASSSQEDSNGNGTIQLWRASDGACLRTITIPGAFVDSIAFAPDGQTLATSSMNVEIPLFSIQLWRVCDGACLQTITVSSAFVASIAFAPDGQTLASGGWEYNGAPGIVQLWSVSDGTCLQTLTSSGSVGTVAFAPDGQTLAAGGYDATGNGSANLWRISDGACLQTFTVPTTGEGFPEIGPGQPAVAFAPDGHTLAFGANGTIELWRVSDGACLQTLTSLNDVTAVAFASDGQTLAVANWDNIGADGGNGMVQLWRVSDGACLQTITDPSLQCLTSMAFAPDGQTLATGNVGGVTLWNLASPLTAVTITASPTSPTTVGTEVRLTATAAGGAQPEYKFYAVYPDASGKYQLLPICDYSVNCTCTWTPTLAENYTLVVCCREQGTTVPYAVYGLLNYAVKTTLSAVALAATPPSSTSVGTTVKLSATPTGGAHPEFKFYAVYLDANGKYQLLPIRDYAATSTCTWTPTFTAFYTLVVCCREQGETTPYDVYGTLSYTVKPALSAVTLAATSPTPNIVGATVNMSATATGGAHPEYKFYAVYLDANGKYQLLPIRDYAATSTCSWTPTFTDTYALVVCCREQGTTVPYAVYGTLGYVVKPALTAVALAVTPTSSTALGTTVVLNATPTGGAHPVYMFYAVYLDACGKYQLLPIRSYGASSTCSWTPTFAASYALVVDCREQGSSTQPLDAIVSGYKVK